MRHFSDFGGLSMKREHKETVFSLSLFRGCGRELIERTIISRGYVKVFRSGETMETDSSPSVGILLSGRGVIYSSDKGRKTLLRFISPGSAVGVAGLFAAEPPLTRIEACGDGKSEMFFVGREAFEDLLSAETDGAFRNNLIRFLADRVSFLNSRIDCVTAGSAERKLAIFIKNSPVDPLGNIDIGMSMTALAHALDIGRASLYRAFESLEKAEIITRNGNTVTLLSQSKLDEIC